MNNNNTIEDLIAKQLAGEATADEKQLLAAWLKENDANRVYYDSLENIFRQSTEIKMPAVVDTDAAWARLKTEMDVAVKTQPVKNLFTNVNVIWRLAAIFILVAGIGISLFIQFNKKEQWLTETTTTSPKWLTLPDSSTVFLNKNSHIEYAYSSKLREVKLNGEAFFEVKHNDANPFIVKAGGLAIKDIGTAFNVKLVNADSVEVMVESGEVSLSADQTSPLNLIKGERSIYSRQHKIITKLSLSDENTLSYLTKIFVFENASLETVAAKLNEVYGSAIIINDNIKHCRLTATFKNEKIDIILEVIAETLQLQITKNNNITILEGNSCEK